MNSGGRPPTGSPWNWPGWAGDVAVNNANLGVAQFQLKLLEKQGRSPHRHPVPGEIHPGALIAHLRISSVG